MPQYKHDRFSKLYVQVAYRQKGVAAKDIQIHNDENLEIDLMFVGNFDREIWQQQNLGLFDRLMQHSPTIIIEHYSGYLEGVDINTCLVRKELYWQPERRKQIKAAKQSQDLEPSQKLSPAEMVNIDRHEPFTWILAVNCSKKLLQSCGAKSNGRWGHGVYILPALFRMGIVVIEHLPFTSDTLWLKMLGGKESARWAFGQIKQLSTAIAVQPAVGTASGNDNRSLGNDIMALSAKYCAYLKSSDPNTLTTEEIEIMKTMEEIDAWYDAQLLQTRLDGKAEGEELQRRSIALKMLAENLDPSTIAKITGFTPEQLGRLQSDVKN